MKQTVYTFVFAPQDTLFQLYQEIYIKCWTTSMNRVAFKLLVIKQTVLHFFYSRQLVCMINGWFTLQLTAWTKFSVSCIYLWKHFSKKLTEVRDFTSIHIVLPQPWIPQTNEIWVAMPVTIPRGINVSYNYRYFKLQRNCNSLSRPADFNCVHNQEMKLM